jgi:anti-anti-sigma factor
MSAATTGPGVLRIEGEMTIYRAAQLKDEMLTALSASQALDLDLASVTEMDTAGAQLLLLLQREAKAVGKPVCLTAQSQSVAEVMRLCGIDAVFTA